VDQKRNDVQGGVGYREKFSLILDFNKPRVVAVLAFRLEFIANSRSGNREGA